MQKKLSVFFNHGAYAKPGVFKHFQSISTLSCAGKVILYEMEIISLKVRRLKNERCFRKPLHHSISSLKASFIDLFFLLQFILEDKIGVHSLIFPYETHISNPKTHFMKISKEQFVKIWKFSLKQIQCQPSRYQQLIKYNIYVE